MRESRSFAFNENECSNCEIFCLLNILLYVKPSAAVGKTKPCYLANFPLTVTQRTESSVQNLIATERKGSIDFLFRSTIATSPPLETVDQTLPSILRIKRSEEVLNSWMDFSHLFVWWIFPSHSFSSAEHN